MIRDAHHHIVNCRNINSIYNCYKLDDFDRLEEVEAKYINIGLHPLYLPEDIPWDRILSLIFGSNINIGEVGLDRRGDLDRQEAVLREFLDLALEYNKSVSVHCVKAWGRLLEVVKEYPGIRYLFHGYSGSIETLRSLMNFDSWFSFSIRELDRDRMLDTIRSIPIDRVLIESDLSSSTGYRETLEASLGKLSQILSVPREDFNSIISNNFNDFLNRR